MRLIENWRSAWRWFSVQALATVMVLPLVWAGLPADVKGWIPQSWHIWIFVALGGAGIVGRIVDQNPKAPSP